MISPFMFEVTPRADTVEVKAVPLSAATPETMFGTADPGLVSPHEMYQRVSWVYRCISYRAGAVAGIPFDIEGRASRRIDMKLLQNKLPDLLYRIEASLCIDGGAYLFVEQNKARVLDLKWLNFNTIRPQYDQMGVTGFIRTVNGVERDLTLKDVVYFWLPDPLVEAGPGTSPTEVSLKAAGIIANANEFTTQFFARGGINFTLLVTDPATSDPDLKRLEAWWKRLMAGARQAWQTVAMRRNVDVKQVGYEPAKLAMKELKQEARAEIVAAFGLSEDVVTANAANFATATTHSISTLQHTIIPQTMIIASALNEQLLNPLGLEISFHPERLEEMQHANAMQAGSIIQLYQAGIISLQQAQLATGFPQPDAPIVGGSEGGVDVTGENTPGTGEIPATPNDRPLPKPLGEPR